MIGLTLVILAQAATPTPASTAPIEPASSKMTCRRYDVIGSLVKKQKVCRTKAEWGRVEEDMRNETERLRPHISSQAPG